jgi:hypothetical protein
MFDHHLAHARTSEGDLHQRDNSLRVMRLGVEPISDHISNGCAVLLKHHHVPIAV